VWPPAGASGPDPRIPATPFLAASQPGNLAATPVNPPDFTLNHDWLHITNISPDGRFVNLWNLAPYDRISQQRLSAFNAVPIDPARLAANGLWRPQPPAIVSGSGSVRAELGFG
jgi:hypothetical protein